MTKHILFFIVFLFFAGILSSQNHMDVMTTMTGEHNHSYMGWIMTTLDWNGDGYDDLVINEKQWKPVDSTAIHSFGKLLVYCGGPGFDNIPEMEIPGQYQWEYTNTTTMCNAGDMNGDGIDDLALFRSTPFENGNDQAYDLQLCVYYGGAEPDTIPDYVLTFPRAQWDNEYAIVAGLGDINQDGYDDIGYTMRPATYTAPIVFEIDYGGTMGNTIFLQAGKNNLSGKMIGIGDINADSIDDFMIGYYHTVNGNECKNMDTPIFY